MIFIVKILKEQLQHFHLIFRIAMYESKGKYTMHYLGAIWHLLNPLTQMFVYWLVFGLGIRGGAPVGDTPFFLWLIVGLLPWLFISPTVVQGSNSIYMKLHVVSKMKFPVSVLPAVVIVTNSVSLLVMLLLVIIILAIYGLNPGYYFLQLPYYLVCLYFLLFSITILFSTITTIIRDIQNVIQSAMRMMLYLLPILWNMEQLPAFLYNIIRLNPFFYIIEGFRNSLLAEGWFFNDIIYTIYFWSINLLVLFIGSFVHEKFRNDFMDYI